MTVADDLDRIADDTEFSGVAVARRKNESIAAVAAGYADRAHRIPTTLDTQFGIASGTKGLTALTVASLVESGALTMDTTLRSLVGDELPLVDPAVTIEHLLGHTSGVGDYLDEDQMGDIDAHLLDVSAHHLETPDDYLPLIDCHDQVSAPGARFKYNNSGYIMLSIAIERASGRGFHSLVQERLFERAGMANSGFFRSDSLPSEAAIGYLGDGRTNVFHLPVIGGGDGGAYSTADDMATLWAALFAGRIVSKTMVQLMTSPRSFEPDTGFSYGLGFWLQPDHGVVKLVGMDPGVSFRTAYVPTSDLSYAVLSNTSGGAWPLARYLDDRVLNLAADPG